MKTKMNNDYNNFGCVSFFNTKNKNKNISAAFKAGILESIFNSI